MKKERRRKRRTMKTVTRAVCGIVIPKDLASPSLGIHVADVTKLRTCDVRKCFSYHHSRTKRKVGENGHRDAVT